MTASQSVAAPCAGAGNHQNKCVCPCQRVWPRGECHAWPRSFAIVHRQRSRNELLHQIGALLTAFWRAHIVLVPLSFEKTRVNPVGPPVWLRGLRP